MTQKITQEEFDRAIRWLEGEKKLFAERLAPLYESLGWKWAGKAGDYIPHACHLEATIDQLIEDLKQDRGDMPELNMYHIVTGGITVSIEKSRANLSFELNHSKFWPQES
jgi:hypothetical protein